MHTILITGGTGCIGAVTIYKLLQSDEVGRIVVASRTNNKDPLKLWLGEHLDPRLEFATLDVSDYQAIKSVVLEADPSHIIHLGAFQSPDCSARHVQGMEINTGGTMVLFDTAEKLKGLKKFVFASSAAVYGKRAMYPEKSVHEDLRLAPPNHYGIWKLAGEHLARLFYENTAVPTVCLRLNTTYGKGRDKGKTSAPTNALKAIALGHVSGRVIPFEMPYQGRENYHFVEDVGAHFSHVTLQPLEGFGSFNIKGETIPVDSFLDIVRDEAEKLGMGNAVEISIAEDADPNLFVSDLDHRKIDKTFQDLPLTSINEGVRNSLLAFREMAEKSLLTQAMLNI
ncbi:NAD-dependent epimerase/dehydratase family protein [Poritiphilus flavus]|uniref:NAD-dependent epimerase/dehydratase family protein n=1 Tax=Poritiphilus flavus TaxID=2697053 RepID=A0A6L9EAD3_9FLAO|nr:SDR family oxidoreductase [Poritiphilus flavus]NAS11542.1 NAD-dependent epimerase/dehydratase family protein [Poritiphilus flavus]